MCYAICVEEVNVILKVEAVQEVIESICISHGMDCQCVY